MSSRQNRARPDDAPLTRAERNRENAKHSTGPVTPEGKARSSQNALKHGLYAKSPVIRGEDTEARDQLRTAFADDLCPFGAAEWEAVEDAVDAAWRKRRYRRIEAEIFERAFDEAGDQPLAAPLALDGEHGRQLTLCLRAGGRAVREYRSAMRDLVDVRRSRDKGGPSWYEGQNARWAYEMDKNHAPSSWMHSDGYFLGAAANAEAHPPEFGRGDDPATTARTPAIQAVAKPFELPSEPDFPRGSLVADEPADDADDAAERATPDFETKPTPPGSMRSSPLRPRAQAR